MLHPFSPPLDEPVVTAVIFSMRLLAFNSFPIWEASSPVLQTFFFTSYPLLHTNPMLPQTKEKVKPPRSLRSARRSLVKNKISTPLSFPTTFHSSISAPKKIIKALYDYQAQGPHELSFAQGDFFHVTGRENDDRWFEACNPATNSKGLVPVSYFQVLDKSERNLSVAQPQTGSAAPPHAQQKIDSGFIDNEHDVAHGNFRNRYNLLFF